MKRLILLNVTAPPLLSTAIIVTARLDKVAILLFFFSAAILIGLAVVNLVAPLLLWKRNGPRSLIPLVILVAAACASGMAATYGSRLAMAGTPSAPDSFLRGSTQSGLELLANRLLDEGRSDAIVSSLREYGFTSTSVDSVRRVVTLRHNRMRTWYEYIYAENGLPAAYSTKPTLADEDFVNWGELRLIAEQAVPETKRTRGAIVFEPSLAVPYLQQALGDSGLQDLRGSSPPRRVTREEKELVIAALNRQCSIASRLIESSEITYEGTPPVLHIGANVISNGFWVSALLRTELSNGVILRDLPPES